MYKKINSHSISCKKRREKKKHLEHGQKVLAHTIIFMHLLSKILLQLVFVAHEVSEECEEFDNANEVVNELGVEHFRV